MNSGSETGGSAGPIIGIVVILVIVVLAGLYFWNQRSGDVLPLPEGIEESLGTQSESDESASIEADLEATDVEIIDIDVNAS